MSWKKTYWKSGIISCVVLLLFPSAPCRKQGTPLKSSNRINPIVLCDKLHPEPFRKLLFLKAKPLYKNYFDIDPIDEITFTSLVSPYFTIVYYSKMFLMEATAYYPGPECTGKNAYHGLTFSGKKARYGLIAVDPRIIPLGALLYVEGYGMAEAADIGGAIKGQRIDLCFNTYREAVCYGRKKVGVFVLMPQ